MINPVFRTSTFRKICYDLDKFGESVFFKFFIKPFLFGLPLACAASILPKSELIKKFTGFVGPELIKWVLDNQIGLIFVVFIVFAAMNSIGAFIKKYSAPDIELNRDDLHSILCSIDHVVSGKKTRFLDATKKALQEGWNNEKIFTTITQPDQQIALQIQAIHGIFDYLYGNKINFRIGLMAIEDNKPKDWAYFVPDEYPPKTSAETLSAPTSTIMQALKKQSLVVVENIQSELKVNKDKRRFIKGSSDELSEGSILAYPIYCPNTRKPIYVLSLLGKKKNCFESKKTEFYSWVLENFLGRILIEHHLMLLKNGGSSQHEC